MILQIKLDEEKSKHAGLIDSTNDFGPTCWQSFLRLVKGTAMPYNYQRR